MASRNFNSKLRRSNVSRQKTRMVVVEEKGIGGRVRGHPGKPNPDVPSIMLAPRFSRTVRVVRDVGIDDPEGGITVYKQDLFTQDVDDYGAFSNPLPVTRWNGLYLRKVTARLLLGADPATGPVSLSLIPNSRTQASIAPIQDYGTPGSASAASSWIFGDADQGLPYVQGGDSEYVFKASVTFGPSAPDTASARVVFDADVVFY